MLAGEITEGEGGTDGQKTGPRRRRCDSREKGDSWNQGQGTPEIGRKTSPGKTVPSEAMETRETGTGISASIRQETDWRKKVLGKREGFVSPVYPLGRTKDVAVGRGLDGGKDRHPALRSLP